MKQLFLSIFIVAAVFTISSCGPDPKPDNDSEEVQGKGNSSEDAKTGGANLDTKFDENSSLTDEEYNAQFEEDALLPKEFEDPSNPLSKMVIYFDFDSSKVKPKFHEIILAHAEFLMANPGFNLLIEGHTDERGTREYNVGLGERRANAVKEMLEIQGLSANRLKAISYGEEKPANMDLDEVAQSQNRRAVLVYTKR